MDSLIDDRNKSLWERLKSQRNIQVIIEDREDYMIYTKGEEVKIYVKKNDLNPASFTHELMHLDLDLKGVIVGASLKSHIRSSEISEYFEDELIEHLGNCLSHSKMLTEFINLGYPESDFIEDFSVNKCTGEEMCQIEELLFNEVNGINFCIVEAFRAYIGKFFAMKACPNQLYDYSSSFQRLENLNPALYAVLIKLWDEWTLYDATTPDDALNSYRLIIYDFLFALEQWCRLHSFKKVLL